MSMTTELELAQRMKAAALNATGAYERLSMMPEGDIFDISLAEGTQLDADITALNSFHDEATPANVLALVEALEASQSENERMYKTLSERNGEPVEGLVKRIAELEAKLAVPVKLPKTNGYWTEQEKAFEEGITLAKRQVRLAGFQVIEGEQNNG